MISVILPIYNIETGYLETCLGSLRNQSYSKFEVLMVDDGSNAYVHDVCEKFADQDARFFYIRQDNAGVCVARNNGMDRAKGEYICFIDPDDWIDENYLDVLYNSITENDADIALVDSLVHYAKRAVENHFLDTGKTVLSGESKNKLLYQLFSRTICDYYPPEIPAGTVWAKIFRTDFLSARDLRFLPGLKRMEDILFCMYAYEEAEKIAYLPDCLYHYRVSGDSVSHRYDPEVIEQFERFFGEAQRFLDRYHKEPLLQEALAMRELTAVHSYMRFYYFSSPTLSRQEANREIDRLLEREPYATALQRIDKTLLSKSELIFVTALKNRQYSLLRALVKGRERLKK